MRGSWDSSARGPKRLTGRSMSCRLCGLRFGDPNSGRMPVEARKKSKREMFASERRLALGLLVLSETCPYRKADGQRLWDLSCHRCWWWVGRASRRKTKNLARGFTVLKTWPMLWKRWEKGGDIRTVRCDVCRFPSSPAPRPPFPFRGWAFGVTTPRAGIRTSHVGYWGQRGPGRTCERPVSVVSFARAGHLQGNDAGRCELSRLHPKPRTWRALLFKESMCHSVLY